MNKPLKQIVRDHIELNELTDDQLQKLESLAGEVTSKNVQAEIVRNRLIYPMTIVGVAVVFLLAYILTPYIFEQGNVRERIAKEVAANHIKLKPLEVETSHIEGIRTYFTKLDFLPVNSRLVSEANIELIGGRYCSLQGVTAAQLRLQKTGSKAVQTLYQTEYRKDVFDDIPQLEKGEKPVEIFVKGIKVTVWVEKDVLFALTDLPVSP